MWCSRASKAPLTRSRGPLISMHLQFCIFMLSATADDVLVHQSLSCRQQIQWGSVGKAMQLLHLL